MGGLGAGRGAGAGACVGAVAGVGACVESARARGNEVAVAVAAEGEEAGAWADVDTMTCHRLCRLPPGGHLPETLCTHFFVTTRGCRGASPESDHRG